jgi:hypothetical protein
MSNKLDTKIEEVCNDLEINDLDIKRAVPIILKWYLKEILPEREALAELEHEQWMKWSLDIVTVEKISPERLLRWNDLWIPYNMLTEEEKDQDRIWADKVIQIITRSELSGNEDIKK